MLRSIVSRLCLEVSFIVLACYLLTYDKCALTSPKSALSCQVRIRSKVNVIWQEYLPFVLLTSVSLAI